MKLKSFIAPEKAISKMINFQRIESAIEFLTENFRSQPDLNEIAAKICLSPFHFHRIFTELVGISPKRFLQHLTLDYLRNTIHETANNIEAAELVGLSSQSRLHDLFVQIDGVSPLQFRMAGVGLNIFYGYHPTPFGECFIAVTNKGICALKFIDEQCKYLEYEHFIAQWRFATLIHKPNFTQLYIQKIFDPAKLSFDKLHLIVNGTDFKAKVWEALIQIPIGSDRTFHSTAKFFRKQKSSVTTGPGIGGNSILSGTSRERIRKHKNLTN